jgi:hypothetical protein
VSRACRSAFAYVVVLLDAGLETTPAEEMAGVEAEPVQYRPAAAQAAQPPRAGRKPAAPRAMAEQTPEQRARLAIASAPDVDECDAIRRRLDVTLADGGFSAATHRELVGMVLERADILGGVNQEGGSA